MSLRQARATAREQKRTPPTTEDETLWIELAEKALRTDTNNEMKLIGTIIFVAFWTLLSTLPLFGLSYCLHECGGSHFLAASHQCCCHHSPSLEPSNRCMGTVVSLSLEQAPVPSSKNVSDNSVLAILADVPISSRDCEDFSMFAPACRGGPPEPTTYLSLPLLM